MPHLSACGLEPAPGQRRREEALPPACRRRPRLPADPYTRPPAYAAGVPKSCYEKSSPVGERGGGSADLVGPVVFEDDVDTAEQLPRDGAHSGTPGLALVETVVQ